MNITWHIKTFDELKAIELYQILKIRAEVFILEQNCNYLDIDDSDQKAWHIWAEHEGHIAAYCRTFPAGVKYPEASIGRVLTAQAYRQMALGKALILKALLSIEINFKTISVRISAQDYLLKFYSDLGFVDTGKKYLEDDIPHTEMIKL